jgi:hypothetical protein
MTIDFRAAAGLAFTGAVMVLMSGTAHAQGQGFARVHGSVEEVYDTNIFAVAETATTQPQADWITLFGPAVEAGYQTLPMRFEAHYGLNAEKYRTHTDLDKAVARQDAGTSLRYEGRTFSVNLRAGYLYTQTPTDLNLETMIFVGRSQAQRADSAEAFVFNVSPLTSVKLDHEFSRDSLVGAVSTLRHSARLGIARKLSERSTIRADYRPDLFDFSSGLQQRSHAGTFGVVHAFSPMLEVEFDGGVRSTSGDIDPEIAAAMRHRMERGALALRYVRTRETTIGEGASLEVQRINAEVTYTPTRVIGFTIAPARASSGGTLSHDVVYYLDIRTQIQAARRWAILGVGRVGRQDRRIPISAATDPITGEIFPTSAAIDYRSISFKTIVTLGPLERKREDAETETP